MRGIVIAASIVLAATAATAAEAPSENVTLAKKVMAVTGGADDARASVLPMTETMASGFATGADNADVVINQKTLARSVRAEVKAYKPQFVNAGVQAYAKVYTTAELRQFIAYYHKSEARRGRLPQSLTDKTSALAEERAANAVPLRLKLKSDLFKAYCSKAACNDKINKMIVAFGHN